MRMITCTMLIAGLCIGLSGMTQAGTLMNNGEPITAHESLQTLISGDIESGGYGAPVVKTTTVNGETGVLVGGQGAWIINHMFALGGGGYGLASSVDVPDLALRTYTDPDDNQRDLELGMGYGGVLIEYFNRPQSLVHFTTSALIGAGGIVYAEYEDDDEYKENSTWDTHDAFFVFEPGIHAEVNVTTWMRIAAGGSYLLIRDLDMVGLDNSDIGGFTGNIAFKFGSF